MTIPAWVQEILDRFDSKTEPHNEVDIAQALSDERAQHGDLSEEDWKVFVAEHSAFFFMGSREGASVWARTSPQWPSGLRRDHSSKSRHCAAKC